MIMTYLALVLFVGTLTMLAHRRLNKLEAVYGEVCHDLANLVHNRAEANLNVLEAASRQYKLAMRVQRRDVLETRCESWTGRYESLLGFYNTLVGWRGRTTPYLIGAIDALGGLLALDAVGLMPRYANVAHLTQVYWAMLMGG